MQIRKTTQYEMAMSAKELKTLYYSIAPDNRAFTDEGLSTDLAYEIEGAIGEFVDLGSNDES